MKLTIFFGIVLMFGLAASASVGPTKDCDIMCPMIYQPVCGVETRADGTTEKRTFSNSCVMRVVNICEGRNYVPC